jgi:hypothetical protein
MYGPGNGQLRYLIHSDDGGSRVRMRDAARAGADLVDGGRYGVVRVEPGGRTRKAFGHVRAELID